VSNDEVHRMIGELTTAKMAVLRRRSEIDIKLEGVGARLEQLGRALRDLERSISKNALADLVRFGPESGVTVDGIVELVNERNRLSNQVDGYESKLRNLGV
jgi:hypothetical protein